MRENNRAARAARFLGQIFDKQQFLSTKRRREISLCEATGTRRRQSLILCLYLKTILAKQKFNKDIAPLGKIVRHMFAID